MRAGRRCDLMTTAMPPDSDDPGRDGARLRLAVHGCALTPVTVMATLFAGPNFILFMTAMVAMGIALVTNLAAMPTKITIPAFALSILIDVVILISCAGMAIS